MIQFDVSDDVCVLRLSAPLLNTITFALLEELRAAIRRANREARGRGIVIFGGPRHFSPGADITMFRDIACAEDAVRVSRIFQDAFEEVEDSQKPVVAALAGKVLGGALELATACHFRVCSKNTRFSMPEVNLGANPAAGGTQRLPRLVGLEPALKMLLSAEAIDAQQALALGLVDVVCEGEELLESARALLRSGPALRRTSRRADKVSDARANDAAFAGADELLQTVRPEMVAPRKIVEVVKVGLEESFYAGLRREREVFAECLCAPATRNKMYLYFAARRMSEVPHLPGARPAKVNHAAVIGMGTMGTGIALALATAGVPVVVRDEDPTALEKGMERIRTSTGKRVASGKMSEERAEGMLRLISTTTGWREIAEVDLVIESVFEDAPTKCRVIARLEEVCSAGTIIASNTSTISLDVLAEDMQHAERLVGMHFFNPAHRMPLVEIIRREATPDRVIATALRFARTLRKTPVVVNNREGFLVNRIFVPYLKEAFLLLEDGADAPVIDSAMVEFGFAMGPLMLVDMAGLDILAQADSVLSRAYPRHGCLSPIVVHLVEQGHLGRKTASGVYKYEQGDYTSHPGEAARRIIAEVRKRRGCATGEIGKDEIIRRLVLRMVNEAYYVIEEGVTQRQSDLDVAMVLGAGFPEFRGGVLKYARDLGLGSVVGRLQKLVAKYGERFSPCQLLREMKGTG